MKRVVISDLHIGSMHANEKALQRFLTSISKNYSELVLAGDIIDFIKIPTFTSYSHAILKIIENFDGKVVYIIGNHDISFRNMIGKEAFGIVFTDKYEFTEGERNFRIEHGDRYENGIVHWKNGIKVISVFQDFLERWLKLNISQWYHNLFFRKRKLKRIWDIIRWNEDADVFIMGHNHTPEVLIWVNEMEKIKTYVNTGDWVEHQTYVTIEDGVVRLRNWQLEEEKRNSLSSAAKK